MTEDFAHRNICGKPNATFPITVPCVLKYTFENCFQNFCDIMSLKIRNIDSFLQASIYPSVEKISWLMKSQWSNKLIRCPLGTLTPLTRSYQHKPTKKSTGQTSFPCKIFSVATNSQNALFSYRKLIFRRKLFSSVSHEFGHRAAQQVGLLFQKNQSKIWFNKGMMIRINYGTTF